MPKRFAVASNADRRRLRAKLQITNCRRSPRTGRGGLRGKARLAAANVVHDPHPGLPPQGGKERLTESAGLVIEQPASV
jgi:hypothetical protein